jgi:DUF2934 family protein
VIAVDQEVEAHKLERELERAKRLANSVTDQTTSHRLWSFVEELRLKLKRFLAARRATEEIRTRAHELWEQQGRPAGRDVEFWLQAETESKTKLACSQPDASARN